MSKKALLEDEILINLAISDFKNSWLKVVKLFERPKGTTTFQPLFIFLKKRKGHGGSIFQEEDQVALYIR